MKILLTSLAACLLFTVGDISMLNIKIGSPQSGLKNIKLEEVAKDGGMVKYRTKNRNDFSITAVDGKVAFMENDWLQDASAKTSLLPGFTFGETSLKDIRKKFGTNGFSYTNMSGGATETHVIQLNCFEFDSPNNEVLVTITKVALDAGANEDNVSSLLKLDALIIADKAYLDEIWGSEKVYDPNYKKIKL